MDTKWLEDFVSLSRTRSFSRSAEERHVTQSAFSRRIQSLETWVGVPLIDRSSYPTTLTAAGRQFRETAEETLRQLEDSRMTLQAGARPRRGAVAIAALHTLALSFFPGWFRAIEARTGPLESRILPDDFHNCLEALVEGEYDFFLTFYHPDVPIVLDPSRFPHVVVGMDSMVAVSAPDLATPKSEPPPVLAYGANSFLGRVTALAEARSILPATNTPHVVENAMAEALKLMAVAGHGAAWLPRSLVVRELAGGALVPLGAEIPLEIRLYRKADHKRSVVEKLWVAASKDMQNRNIPD
ncbi:LysR family transcriptional regulator [Agrobacterium tumefaciens]|nr:LysR family transcriptional regulator [Agrobacterium tumefaciens]